MCQSSKTYRNNNLIIWQTAELAELALNWFLFSKLLTAYQLYYAKCLLTVLCIQLYYAKCYAYTIIVYKRLF